MTRILLRGGKSPFENISYEDTLAKNILGTNSGNLIFAEAVWKTLSTKGAKITKNGYTANPKKADFINNNYDVLVLPFANAFRTSFIPILNKFTKLINKLEIPVIVTGIGAQAGIGSSSESMSSMNSDVKKFCTAVLKRSASIGVRGEYTYDYIRSLGFSDGEVDIIGCPSMFYYGENFPEIKKNLWLKKNDKISMNVSPYVKGINDIFERNFDYYKQLVYIPQNNESLDQILWEGKWLENFGKVFPKSVNHPMFDQDRLKFFIDTKNWLDYLKDFKFVFGTRIHGNVMGLLAGVPSYVLAHDSRTLELARYFDIPHRLMQDLPDNVMADQLFYEADYSKLILGHKTRFDTWVSFLEKNGLRHIYMNGEDNGRAFIKKLDTIKIPAHMPTIPNQNIDHFKKRMIWQMSYTNAKINKIVAENKKFKLFQGV